MHKRKLTTSNQLLKLVVVSLTFYLLMTLFGCSHKTNVKPTNVTDKVDTDVADFFKSDVSICLSGGGFRAPSLVKMNVNTDVL